MLNFPDLPTVNQIFTSGSLTWQWDGAKWLATGVTPPQAILVVNATVTLTQGYAGFVRVENTTAAPITITLPLSPTPGQEITLKDTSGNASSFPITINGNGKFIENANTLIISYNFSWVDLWYTGTQWVQI